MKKNRLILVGMTVIILSFAFIFASCDGGAPQVNPFPGTYSGDELSLEVDYAEWTITVGGVGIEGTYSFNSAIYLGGAASTTFFFDGKSIGTASLNGAGDELKLTVVSFVYEEGEPPFSGTFTLERED